MSHSRIVEDARVQFDEIFEKSEQSVYLYLDDANRACNERFARLLGYASAEEWAGVKENFPEAFVAPKSRRTLVSAYRNAVENFAGSTVKVSWVKKNGGEVATTTILVPIQYEGHVMALHFIELA